MDRVDTYFCDLLFFFLNYVLVVNNNIFLSIILIHIFYSSIKELLGSLYGFLEPNLRPIQPKVERVLRINT